MALNDRKAAVRGDLHTEPQTFRTASVLVLKRRSVQ